MFARIFVYLQQQTSIDRLDMSRSYKKNILVCTCFGDNRSYYKMRRRKIKNLGRMQLRRLMANYGPEDVNDLWIEPKVRTKDTWDEPTDGHFGLSLEMYKREMKINRFCSVWYYKDKVERYLKKKSRKRH